MFSDVLIVSGNTITIGSQWDPNQFSNGNIQDLKWRDADSGCVSTNSGDPVTTPCYNIGDIGPGGGIVFALPNTGINNSNFV